MTFDEAVQAIDMDRLERDKRNFRKMMKEKNYVFDPSDSFAMMGTEYPEVLEIRKKMTPEKYANIKKWSQEDWIDHWIAWML